MDRRQFLDLMGAALAIPEVNGVAGTLQVEHDANLVLDDTGAIVEFGYRGTQVARRGLRVDRR